MTMQSSSLLPALLELPGGNDGTHQSFREIMTGLVSTDQAMYAAEFASGASFGLWAIFDDINLDDHLRETMTQAHEMSFANYDGTLTDHWQETMERGPDAMHDFVSDLTFRAAQINVVEQLEQNGYTIESIPDDPSLPISALGLDGREGFFKVVTDPDYASMDDNLSLTITQAYEMAFGNVADTYTVNERWAMKGVSDGEQGFINNLKGKVAEIQAEEPLAQDPRFAGYEQDFIRNEEGIPIPNHEGFDRVATGPNGQEIPITVKSSMADKDFQEVRELLIGNDQAHGAVNTEMYNRFADSDSDLMGRLTDIGSTHELEQSIEETLAIMAEYPEINFHAITEVYDAISDSASDMIDQLTDIGPGYLTVEGTTDGLNALSSNLGIDVPDGIGEIVPYAGAIIAGARLVHSVVRTEREFKAVDRTTKNKIQVVQSLTLMSRMGINTVLATGRCRGWSGGR